MEKVINIGATPVRLKTNGNALRIYKRDFGRDLIPDLFSIYGDKKDLEGVNSGASVDVEKLNPEALYNITYTFAKIADDSIGTLDEWLESLDSFPLVDVANEVIPFVVECISTDATVKKQMASAGLRRTAMSSGRKKFFWRPRRRA